MQFTRENFFEAIKKKKESKNRIGRNTGYYLNLFDRYYPRRRFISWNWAVFFFPIPWLIYRRMYAIASIIWVITLPFMVSFVQKNIFLGGVSELHYYRSEILLYLVYLGINILGGLYGNALYFHFVEEKIRSHTKSNFPCLSPSRTSVFLYFLLGMTLGPVFIALSKLYVF